MTEELKKCPFCGGEAKVVSGNYLQNRWYSVRCTSCWAEIDEMDSMEDAIALWDDRDLSAAKEEVERSPEAFNPGCPICGDIR